MYQRQKMDLNHFYMVLFKYPDVVHYFAPLRPALASSAPKMQPH